METMTRLVGQFNIGNAKFSYFYISSCIFKKLRDRIFMRFDVKSLGFSLAKLADVDL